jgi:peptidyl-tRNA hydrolase, PTH1 family
MKAIIGLGNPGAEYKGTRHNLGFDVVDELARRWHVRLRSWKSVAALGVASDRAVLLAQPKTFMNASGSAVSRIVGFHHVDVPDLLVVADDVNLPLGRLRLRRFGSAGGHNGLRSIIEQVGDQFPRLRIGVGRGDAASDLVDHVLSTFERDERDLVARMITRAADAAEMVADGGVERAMNCFNALGDAEKAEKEDLTHG